MNFPFFIILIVVFKLMGKYISSLWGGKYKIGEWWKPVGEMEKF